MSESKHTPGPWRRGIGSEANTVFDEQKRIVADRCGYADGNLIAAAPDLLEALGNLLRVIEVNDLIPESASYMKRARAAIARATKA